MSVKSILLVWLLTLANSVSKLLSALSEIWRCVLRSNPQQNKIINSLYKHPQNDIIIAIIIFNVRYGIFILPIFLSLKSSSEIYNYSFKILY